MLAVIKQLIVLQHQIGCIFLQYCSKGNSVSLKHVEGAVSFRQFFSWASAMADIVVGSAYIAGDISLWLLKKNEKNFFFVLRIFYHQS